MKTPDRKVRKLMEEYQKTGKLINAAMRADVDPKTARKYQKIEEMQAEGIIQEYRAPLDPPRHQMIPATLDIYA